MEKPDYTELDAAIIKRLENGPRLFTDLYAGNVAKQAHELEQEQEQEKAPGKYPKPAFRFIDSRLQALRKHGLIVYNGKTGWSLI